MLLPVVGADHSGRAELPYSFGIHHTIPHSLLFSCPFHREKKFLRCKRCHASNAANAPNEKPRSPTQKSRSATQNFKNAPSNVAVPTNAATCYQRSLYVAEREIRITNAAFPLQRSLPYRRSIALPTQHLRCQTRNPHSKRSSSVAMQPLLSTQPCPTNAVSALPNEKPALAT
jgi:hypothetical protein